MNKHKGDDDVAFESEEVVSEGDIEIADEENLAAGKVAKVKKELKLCKDQKQEYLDGWQRAKADYVNALRRFEEEKTSIKGKSVAACVEMFLPVLDSLERARGAGELPSGFDAIAKQLSGTFTKLGVSEVPAALGNEFNPMYHEALGQDTTTDTSLDNTISAVLEKGWQVDSIVIRPAKVRVMHHL